MNTARTDTKVSPGIAYSVEDHMDFQSSQIVPGDRFVLTTAMKVFEDAEFCGLWSEYDAENRRQHIVGMKFRIDHDHTLSLRWVEIETLQPING